MCEEVPAGDGKRETQEGLHLHLAGFALRCAGGRRERSKGVGKRDEVPGCGEGRTSRVFQPRLWKAQKGCAALIDFVSVEFLIGCLHLHRNNLIPLHEGAFTGDEKGKRRRDCVPLSAGFAFCSANTLLGAPPPPMKKRPLARFASARNEAQNPGRAALPLYQKTKSLRVPVCIRGLLRVCLDLRAYSTSTISASGQFCRTDSMPLRQEALAL